jgi:hypothetical protein
MWLALLSPALAATVLDYSEGFSGTDDSSFSGTDGWVAGTTADPWSTSSSGGVWATKDETGGTWGSGGPADNHLVQTDRKSVV